MNFTVSPASKSNENTSKHWLRTTVPNFFLKSTYWSSPFKNKKEYIHWDTRLMLQYIPGTQIAWHFCDVGK